MQKLKWCTVYVEELVVHASFIELINGYNWGENEM